MPRASTIVVTSGASAWTATVDDGQVVLAGTAGTFVIREEDDGRCHVSGPSGVFVASAVRSGDVIWVVIDGYVMELHVGTDQAARPAVRDADSLAPLMTANVARIHVRPGDHVQEGDTLVTLEAMKMEMPVRAPRAGTIVAINCTEGTLAAAGTPVVTLE